MTIDGILVGMIVASAVAHIANRIRLALQPKRCGSCGGCPARKL